MYHAAASRQSRGTPGKLATVREFAKDETGVGLHEVCGHLGMDIQTFLSLPDAVQTYHVQAHNQRSKELQQ